MTFAIVRSEREISPSQRAFAGASPGRRPGRLAGGHIDDRVALRKALTLCASCLRKFNATAADYVTKKNLPFVRGRCDGCQSHCERGRLLVHRSLAATT